MLVISLKAGEQIWVGRDITVKILKSKSGLVRLGIDAPADVKVVREILEYKAAAEKAEKNKNKS